MSRRRTCRDARMTSRSQCVRSRRRFGRWARGRASPRHRPGSGRSWSRRGPAGRSRPRPTKRGRHQPSLRASAPLPPQSSSRTPWRGPRPARARSDRAVPPSRAGRCCCCPKRRARPRACAPAHAASRARSGRRARRRRASVRLAVAPPADWEGGPGGRCRRAPTYRLHRLQTTLLTSAPRRRRWRSAAARGRRRRARAVSARSRRRR
mmetsp:Transcript_30492/g.89208  ORF Transcript_30492/g.89208 Transcript_30492/m.89208 type:complete len:208 (+) Transcript_30492:657-1280(+)